MPVASESSSNPLEVLASFGKNKNIKTLLRVLILLFIAGAAISSRLFSVIRESSFHLRFTTAMAPIVSFEHRKSVSTTIDGLGLDVLVKMMTDFWQNLR